ncbi:MAG: regulatory protein LuxR [Mycobacterium sp.]|jgi:DNA-binding CsgD family transcriptional regulator|nr:regulatory protein LuxR [Mycobacterium sp.]
MALVGRRRECAALDALLADLHAGSSRVLVLTGEAGIGKTALLDELTARAGALRVVRVTGVESEIEFAFAALHQLCAPLTQLTPQLPEPQQAALRQAFGADAGPQPDRFLTGLAVLGLLSAASDERPLLFLVDDQQWLDGASAQILAFVARRLGAEPVGMVFATRNPGSELAGLPELDIAGLPDHAAGELLSIALDGPVDARVRDRLIAEARGNPLALLELPRSLSHDQLAGGFGPPGAPVSHSLEATFGRQLDGLPEPTRRLLALAAADPVGDPALLWTAAGLLGLGADDAVPAIEAELLVIETRVRFRHPLIRSTAYRRVPLSDRQRIHRALAETIDPTADPVRRAWHLGHAAVGPDDAVADELRSSAQLVLARGGVAAAASFLERASMLARDVPRRADLALAAAYTKAQAGILVGARELLTAAEAAPLTDAQRAQADLVRAQLAFIANRGNDAAPLLLAAARRLETTEAVRSRDIYLDALLAAIFAGKLAVDGGVLEVAEAAATATRGLDAPRPIDLLLEGMCTQHCEGFEKGLPTVREALHVYGKGLGIEQEMRWMFLACVAAAHLWDLDRLTALSQRYVRLARDSGALSELPLALSCRFSSFLFSGRFEDAGAEVDELCAAIEAMGNNMTPYGAISLAAYRGDRSEVHSRGEAMTENALRRGEGVGLTVVAWATALLHNGFGDYEDALRAGLTATEYPGDCTSAGWALPELVEAATRTGNTAIAEAALDRLADMTTPSGTDWGLAVEARSRALLSDGAVAEVLYRDAVRLSERAGLRPDLARSHLLYGEWLRRQRRRIDARAQLRHALDLFDDLGMSAFAERARRELAATGEKARRRKLPASTELTAQEAQIARLAREGLSNPEIGARLFISARTVQYHLAKVFTKLGIRSRSQLDAALTDA